MVFSLDKKINPGSLFFKPSTRKERAHPKQPPLPYCVWMASWSAAMDKSKKVPPTASSDFPWSRVRPIRVPSVTRSYIAKVCIVISFPFFAVHDGLAWPGWPSRSRQPAAPAHVVRRRHSRVAERQVLAPCQYVVSSIAPPWWVWHRACASVQLVCGRTSVCMPVLCAWSFISLQRLAS